ncbi:SRPBCC family protein [Streptomyces sp. AV19]|uniref:SRPBCC family protein n=1 Tax=Streptomyces sp. AV19 TaxID=2793068 RepID=UPI0024132CB3|nr:SRPBCC family protein [Streptomyces sp. AV19]MDG4535703.1 SRPBCC family protein [Streptomyces sp. AV19]
MIRQWSVEESIVIGSRPDAVFRAVSDVRRMGEWSPECRAVWLCQRPVREGSFFIGFNRRGLALWFTSCRVTCCDPGQEFTFRVSAFGLPVAHWGYRFEPASDGSTIVTECWRDLRTGRGARLTELLGLIFTATRPVDRARVNRAGMRTTLTRLKQTCEA